MIANWLKNLLAAFLLQAAVGFAFNGSEAEPIATPQSCQMPAASTLSSNTGAHS